MRRVTADTNVYVSVSNFNGPRNFLCLRAMARYGWRSPAILDEVVDGLDREFHWPKARIDGLRKTLLSILERNYYRLLRKLGAPARSTALEQCRQQSRWRTSRRVRWSADGSLRHAKQAEDQPAPWWR